MLILIEKKRFLIMLLAALAVTVVTGWVYGRLTQRWGVAPDLLAKAQHFESFPTDIGDWQLLETEPLSELIQEMLLCAGYVNQKYVNKTTGETVWLAITLGPAGPISVHTPEICYSSRAYTIEEQRAAVEVPAPSGKVHSFWRVTFRSNNPTADVLRVFYAWSTDGVWKASNSPRFEYGGRPALYKLQISSPIPAAEANASREPCKNFLTELLRSGWNLE
jgi:hypothetical protein